MRTLELEGAPWFVLKDICTVLGLGNVTAVSERLEEDEVSQTKVTDSSGREQLSLIVSESGLYAVIMRSDKPEARKFRKWVTSEVLPAIRKQGEYISRKAVLQLLSQRFGVFHLNAESLLYARQLPEREGWYLTLAETFIVLGIGSEQFTSYMERMGAEFIQGEHFVSADDSSGIVLTKRGYIQLAMNVYSPETRRLHELFEDAVLDYVEVSYGNAGGEEANPRS